MARKLSPLTAQLVLDINKWTAGIKQVAKDQEAIKKALKPLQEQTKQLGTVFVAAGVAVGGAMLAMAKKAADFGDEMLEASQKTGLSTKSLSAFRLLAEQSGTSFDGITAGVGKLSRSMFEAATKGGEAAKTFAALGISVKDSSGKLREASDVLPQIADRFANMRDGTEKTALAMKLFGKAGADLIPMLNQGAEGIRKATELTEKYSVSLTEAEAKLGDDFNDALAESKTAMMGLALQIGNALLPAMTKMVAVGNNVIAMVARWVKENPGLTRTVAAAALALTGTGGLLLGMSGFLLIAPKMIANVQLLAKAFLGLSVPLRLVVIGIAAVTAAFLAFPQIRGPVLDVLQKVYQGVTAVVSGLSNLAFSVAHFVTSVVSGDFRRAFDGFSNLPQNITEDIEAAGKRFTDFVGAIKGGISDINAATQGMQVKGFGKEMAVDLAEFGKETSKTKDQIDQLWASLKRENSEADALIAVLHRAHAANIPLVQIQATLGSKIREVADEFMAMGLVVPNVIAQYDSLAFAQEELNRITEETTAKFQEQREAFRKNAPDIFGGAEIPIIRSPAAQAQLDELERRGRITDSLDKQRKEVVQLANDIARLNHEGLSAAEIQAALGVNLGNVVANAKELGVQIDPIVRKLDQSVRIAENWGQSVERLTNDITDVTIDTLFNKTQKLKKNQGELNRFAKEFGIEQRRINETVEEYYERVKEASKANEEFAQMFQHADQSGESFFRKLGTMARDTAKDMLKSMVKGFLEPFTAKLADMARGAGQSFADWVLGTKRGANQAAAGQQGGSGGLLGDLLGGGGGGLLGGILNRGGGPSQGDWTRLPIPGGGGGTPPFNPNAGMGGGTMSGFGQFMALNPGQLLSAGFGAVKGITEAIGAGRDSANEITKSQNAFISQTLKGILDDANLSASNKLKLVMNEWQTFQDALTRFAAGGGENPVTANQAFATVSPLIANIQRDLMKEGASLNGGAGTGEFVHNGDVVFTFALPSDVTTPEKWLDWWDKNKAGIRARVAEGVFAMEGAIVAR